MELQSNEVDKIAAALLAVQAVLKPAIKSSENPFFHSSYASLESVWEACRKPFQDNGIVAIQGAGSVDGDPYLITTLLHKSGQWIRGAFPLPPSTITTRENKDGKDIEIVKTDPQSLGSTISYLRRYSLASMVGIVTADDDAESAMSRDNDLPPNQTKSYNQPSSGSFDRDAVLGFGKHRDKIWRDAPSDYLEWLITNGTGDRQKFAENELALRNDDDVHQPFPDDL